MLIILLGLPQSGKLTLSSHLLQQHSFTRISLDSSASPNTSTLHFEDSTACLEYVTRNWRVNYVTCDLRNLKTVKEFAKRPFVVVVGVEAPLVVRYGRCVMGAISRGIRSTSLEDFVIKDDRILYGLPSPPTLDSASDEVSTLSLSSSSKPEPLSPLLHLATATLLNSSQLKETFTDTIDGAFLERLREGLRPGWDSYFMMLAGLASLRSNCMKRRVGAVLVREKRVVSTGYNGTPRLVRNCSEGGCGRCNSHSDGLGPSGSSSSTSTATSTPMTVSTSAMGVGLEECLCLHAEENALLEAGRERVSGGGTEGAVLYCNTCPCLRCTVKIVQSGVREVVYSLSYSMDDASRRVMEEAGVGLRQIVMPGFPRG